MTSPPPVKVRNLGVRAESHPSASIDSTDLPNRAIQQEHDFLEKQFYSLPLPYLIFSNELRLVNINKIGAALFEGAEINIGRHLSYFLWEEEDGIESNTNLDEKGESLRKQFQRYSDHTEASSMGTTDRLVLEYHTGDRRTRKKRESEVLISYIPSSPRLHSFIPLDRTTPLLSTSNTTEYYSILFLRDSEPDSLRQISGAASSCSPCLSRAATFPSSDSPKISTDLVLGNLPLPLDFGATISSSPNPPYGPRPLEVNQSASSTPFPPHPYRHIPRPLPQSIAALFPELPARLRQNIDTSITDHSLEQLEKSGVKQFFLESIIAPTYNEYQLILDHLPHICFTADPSGLVRYFNRFWYQYTGIKEGTGLDAEVWIQFFHSNGKS